MSRLSHLHGDKHTGIYTTTTICAINGIGFIQTTTHKPAAWFSFQPPTLTQWPTSWPICLTYFLDGPFFFFLCLAHNDSSEVQGILCSFLGFLEHGISFLFGFNLHRQMMSVAMHRYPSRLIKIMSTGVRLYSNGDLLITHRTVWISRSLLSNHDDVIKWTHFPRYWPFVRGIHRWTVNSPHKGHWRGALMFSLICALTNVWANNLRRHPAHHDVAVMWSNQWVTFVATAIYTDQRIVGYHLYITAHIKQWATFGSTVIYHYIYVYYDATRWK